MYNQAKFNIRCEWGIQGIEQLAPISDVVIIVDILSFSTCVDIALSRGASIYPYRWRDASAAAFATIVGAELAGTMRSNKVFSLSPESLLSIPTGTRLVLPSPNGATLTLATGDTPTIVGCFRNARAVAEAAQRYGPKIAVIAAGERWHDDSLRPALEDWLGAGAIIGHLQGLRSPEASAALAAFEAAKDEIITVVREIGSGRELIERGFATNIELATELNVSRCVPLFQEKVFINDEYYG